MDNLNILDFLIFFAILKFKLQNKIMEINVSILERMILFLIVLNFSTKAGASSVICTEISLVRTMISLIFGFASVKKLFHYLISLSIFIKWKIIVNAIIICEIKTIAVNKVNIIFFHSYLYYY